MKDDTSVGLVAGPLVDRNGDAVADGATVAFTFAREGGATANASAQTNDGLAVAKVPLAGTEYIPGVTEERTLSEIKRLLERHLAYPVDYLPEQPTEFAEAGD